MYAKITPAMDWDTSIGHLVAGNTYALPQEVYKNEVWGKVGHTNHGICAASDAEIPSKPVLPPILAQDDPEPEAVQVPERYMALSHFNPSTLSENEE